MFQTVVTIYGAIAAAGGFLLMGWGPMFLRYLGPLVLVNNGSASLIRLAGAGLFLLGAVLLSLRSLQDRTLQRDIGIGMSFAHILAGLLLAVAAAAFAAVLLHAPARPNLVSD